MNRAVLQKEFNKEEIDIFKNDTDTVSFFPKTKIVNGTKSKKPFFEDKNILIYKDDILTTTSVPENSVDLIITSPPYNVDIHYNSNGDDLSYEDYLEFTQKW